MRRDDLCCPTAVVPSFCRELCFALAVLLLGSAWAVGCKTRPRSPADSDRELQVAVANGDHVRVMNLCEAYFAQLRSRDPDPQRTAFMRSVYKRAFVQWFLSSPPQDDEYAQHLARYRAAMASTPGGKQR
jgi:hypothetical protein